MQSWLANLRRRSLLSRSILLALGVTALYAAISPIAGCCDGSQGLIVEAVAAVVCLAGAELALAASHALRAPGHMLWGMLLAMLLRTGIPFGFAVAVWCGNAPLVHSGILYYVVVFYLFTLVLETTLSLPVSEPSSQEVSIRQGLGS